MLFDGQYCAFTRLERSRLLKGADVIVIRLLSLVLIVAAVLVLGRDLYLSFEGAAAEHFVSLTELWQSIDPSSWQTYVGSGPNTSALNTVLVWPAFAVLGTAGIILALVFRPWRS